MNINIYTKMHGATIKIITRAGENTCKHKGMAYLCADTKKILLKTWKKQNGEYMIMGKPQKTVEMLVSLNMHWRGVMEMNTWVLSSMTTPTPTVTPTIQLPTHFVDGLNSGRLWAQLGHICQEKHVPWIQLRTYKKDIKVLYLLPFSLYISLLQYSGPQKKIKYGELKLMKN